MDAIGECYVYLWGALDISGFSCSKVLYTSRYGYDWSLARHDDSRDLCYSKAEKVTGARQT